jgi:K+-transporting ATPase ATPase C chain
MAFLSLSVLTGLAYPLLLAGLAWAAFPGQSAGSLIRLDGRVVGSRLMAQPFSAPGDFWGRPGLGEGAASGGSNLSPGNPDLARAVAARVAALRAADPGQSAPIPVDLVTASGSGWDPHISPQGAEYQAPRVARARGLSLALVLGLVRRHVEPAQFGLLGEPRVDVLELNLALDAIRAR